MVPEGLYELSTLLEKRTGASFTRIVTAALVQHLFGALVPGEPSPQEGVDIYWTWLAIELEKGELAIEDVPMRIIDDCIHGAEKNLAITGDSEAAKGQHRQLIQRKRTLEGRIRKLGKMETVHDMLMNRHPHRHFPLIAP